MRHFRLYLFEPDGVTQLWDAGEFVSFNRKDALVYEGDESYAADLADTFYLVEWAPEDEELRLMGAPTLWDEG